MSAGLEVFGCSEYEHSCCAQEDGELCLYRMNTKKFAHMLVAVLLPKFMNKFGVKETRPVD